MVRARTLCGHKKTAVVKSTAARDNNSMNLFLALFWLICAVLLLAYEHFVGVTRFRLHFRGYNFSYAWFILLLVLYNLKRWRYERNKRARQRLKDLDFSHARQKWQRHRSTPPPDPNVNFTDQPSPPTEDGITDPPPSNHLRPGP